jgi:hypothetical protein
MKIHPNSKETSKVPKSDKFNIKRLNLLKRNSSEFDGSDFLIEDKDECLYARELDPSMSERELSKLLECLDIEQIEGRNQTLPIEPRAVFYISVGASKLQQIVSNHDGDNQYTNTVARSKTGVNFQKFQEEISHKKFADAQQANEFASQYINDFDIDHEEDFHLVDLENVQVMSCVSDALLSIIQLAMRHSAALVIPDYNSGSQGSKWIETAILHADFRGPVINVGNDRWTAVELSQAEETYRFGLNERKKPFLLSRATHSFQVRGNRMDYSRLAARLTRAIAGRPTLTAGLPAAASPPLMARRRRDAPLVACIVACGGMSVVEHVAALAQHALPVIVLEGSGRLCDFLPGVYMR